MHLPFAHAHAHVEIGRRSCTRAEVLSSVRWWWPPWQLSPQQRCSRTPQGTNCSYATSSARAQPAMLFAILTRLLSQREERIGVHVLFCRLQVASSNVCTCLLLCIGRRYSRCSALPHARCSALAMPEMSRIFVFFCCLLVSRMKSKEEKTKNSLVLGIIQN